MEKLGYAQFLTSLEEEECRALAEEAILTRSFSQERAAQAQLRRRMERPRRRVLVPSPPSRALASLRNGYGRPLARRRSPVRRKLVPRSHGDETNTKNTQGNEYIY